MVGGAVKFTCGDFPVTISVQSSDEIAATGSLVIWAHARSHLLRSLWGLYHLDLWANESWGCYAAADTSDEIVDSDHIPLRAAAVGEIGGIAHFGIAALRAGAVDVHQHISAIASVLHPAE